jgi:hypothetical protein
MSIHSDPCSTPLVHVIDADCHYDPTIDDLLIANIGDDVHDDVSISSFASAADGPSTYEDVIGLLTLDGMGTQEINDISEKEQPTPLILPAGPAIKS